MKFPKIRYLVKKLGSLFCLNLILTKNVLSVLPADSSQVHFPNFFTTIAFPMFPIFKRTQILSMIFHLEIDFLKFSDMGRIKSEITKLLLVVGPYLSGIISRIRYSYNLNLKLSTFLNLRSASSPSRSLLKSNFGRKFLKMSRMFPV